MDTIQRVSFVAAVTLAVLLSSSLAGGSPTIARTDPFAAALSRSGSSLAAKKRPKKGKLKIVVAGSGTYTVRGKGLRKRGQRSKSFKVKPGKYTVKAPGGSVKPRRVRVRRGKVSLVKVTFRATAVPRQSGTIGAVQLVSTDAAGAPVEGGGAGAAWSPDGTRIAFDSEASNLVPSDTNNTSDVFVKTLSTGAVQRVSVDAAGVEAEAFSGSPVWSPDGTRVAFISDAANLVPGDTNNRMDVFIKTLSTGVVQLVSVDAGGTQADGRSDDPVWSPDGTRVAFTSNASNLVPGDTNKSVDVFVKTLATGTVQRVSVDAGGAHANARTEEPAWSPDGTRIAFSSVASNLVPGDYNNWGDVFVKTLSTGAVRGISFDAQVAGNATWPVWSPDGTRVAFKDNLDVFVKTLSSAGVQQVSADADGYSADRSSFGHAWSPDGTRIAFNTDASNLVPGDTNGRSDVFVKTLASGAVQRISTDAAGNQIDPSFSGSMFPAWSPDGTRIAFDSDAPNLVLGDTNDSIDVFVKTLP